MQSFKCKLQIEAAFRFPKISLYLWRADLKFTFQISRAHAVPTDADGAASLPAIPNRKSQIALH